MVKILNFFIIQARTFKFGQHIVFGAPITYPLEFFGLGPPFGRQGPPNMGRKQVKRLKSISSYSFIARAFIISECIVLPMAKKMFETEFRCRAPKFFKKFSKMVKILNFLIIQARTFKFRLYVAHRALISYQLKKFNLRAPLGEPGPRKVKI